MAGIDTKILATDYNSIQSKIAAVMGTGGTNPTTLVADNSYGYNQTVASAQVTETPTTQITVTQWTNLRSDIVKARQHQGSGTIDSKGVSDAGYVAGSSLLTPTTSYKITEADRAAYMTMADAAITNRLVTPPTSDATRDSLSSATYVSSWNTSITHTVTIAFASAATALYFFNAGGKIEISASRTGGTTTTKGTSWTNMLANMGTIVFGRDTSSTTGTTPGTISSSLGYYQLTTSDQTLFTKSTENTTYNPNNYSIKARLSSINIVFTIVFADSSGGNIDESIDGTITSLVQAYRPSGTNVSVTGPTLSSSSFA